MKLQKLKFIEVYNNEVYVKFHGSFTNETSAKSPTLKLHNVAVGGKKFPGQREGTQLSLHNPALTPPPNEPIRQTYKTLVTFRKISHFAATSYFVVIQVKRPFGASTPHGRRQTRPQSTVVPAKVTRGVEHPPTAA